jgi:hypothetical protein
VQSKTKNIKKQKRAAKGISGWQLFLYGENHTRWASASFEQ